MCVVSLHLPNAVLTRLLVAACNTLNFNFNLFSKRSALSVSLSLSMSMSFEFSSSAQLFSLAYPTLWLAAVHHMAYALYSHIGVHRQTYQHPYMHALTPCLQF